MRYLPVVSVISVKRFLIAHSEGIWTFFYPKVELLNTHFQVYTILVDQYVSFVNAKYLDLQLFMTDYKNRRLLYLQS